MTDHALDALLAEYTVPPVPAGLAARVAAAALAMPQEPRAPVARRAAAPRHDRRGRWLRRPLLAGGVALGLAVSGAVAAKLAGVRVDWPAIEALLPPFLRGEAPHETVPRRSPPPASVPAPSPAAPVHAAPPVPGVEAVADRGRTETPVPPAPAANADAPLVAVPEPAPARSDLVEPRRIETRAPIQPPGPTIETTRSDAPPAAAPERQAVTPAPTAETRPAATAVDESRLQLERERAERLQAARQAQIERMQRVQQRRERLRRLRRN